MNTPYSLVWLRGIDCDGCTIALLGDTSAGGLEGVVAGGDPAPGLPSINLIHPGFALDSGDAFMEHLRACARGDAGPYALLVETAVTRDEEMAGGWFASLGEEAGQPVSLLTWLTRLAPAADFVMAIGDCAVWGGPHAIGSNPTGSMGVSMGLGVDYRSRLGLPVVNLPGCAVPGGLLAAIAEFVEWACGRSQAPELDQLNRPAALYRGVWKGALALWEA